MTKEEILAEVMAIHNKNIILEISTGGGKSLCALKQIERSLSESNHQKKQVLIVIPKLALIKNWLKEIDKWHLNHLVPFIQFSTYVSLPKNYDKEWDVVCFDEAHHITERCFRSIDASFNRHNVRHLFLSATLSIPFKMILKRTFPDTYVYQLPLKTAIKNNILPDPTILLYPLQLDNSSQTYTYVKRQSGKETVVTYQNRWPVIKRMAKENLSPHILCTEQQYYNLLCDDISFLSAKPKLQNIAKQKRIVRLKILSEFKTSKVLNVLKIIKDYRTITFCSGIEQTERLGKNCIHSKNKVWNDILDDFNSEKIKHVTSCEILSEGMNVADCRIGVFAVINASDIALKQKIGRILRHEKPVIIFPYYVRTREEEIITKCILPQFNQDNVFTIHGVNEILKYLK